MKNFKVALQTNYYLFLNRFRQTVAKGLRMLAVLYDTYPTGGLALSPKAYWLNKRSWVKVRLIVPGSTGYQESVRFWTGLLWKRRF